MMKPETPNDSNPFPTPDPNNLQSEESRASTRERVTKRQGKETDIVDPNKPEDDFDHQNNGGSSPDQPEDLIDRQINIANRSAG